MTKHERDPKRMIDMIFVKRLERRLGRVLTEYELEDHDEPLAFCFPNGHIETIQIPRLRFPHDVITTLESTPTQIKDDIGVGRIERSELQSPDQNQVSAA